MTVTAKSDGAICSSKQADMASIVAGRVAECVSCQLKAQFRAWTSVISSGSRRACFSHRFVIFRVTHDGD